MIRRYIATSGAARAQRAQGVSIPRGHRWSRRYLAADECDELSPSHVEHGLAPAPTDGPVQSACRTLSLPGTDGKSLGRPEVF